MNKKLNDAIAKLHLEPGDALVVDVRVFNVDDIRFARAPRDVRIFPVMPNVGETVHDAFTTIHEAELTKMTREKLISALNMLSPLSGHAAAIIDGIERDFCKCPHEGYIPACAIHERCAALRNLMKVELPSGVYF